MSTTPRCSYKTAITQANMLPTPTWGYLKVNGSAIELPDCLEETSLYNVELEGAIVGTPGAFETALAEYQAHMNAEATQNPADTRAVCIAASGQHDPKDLDIPALSTYQQNATEEEMANDVTAAFQTGMGSEAQEFIEYAAEERLVLEAPTGATAQANVFIDGIANAFNACTIDVVAHENSTMTVNVALSSPLEGQGSVAVSLRVYAGNKSSVGIATFQSAGSNYVTLDNSGFVLAEGATVSVQHYVLGGSKSYTGLAADLRGNDANIAVETHYLGMDAQTRDFNYVLKVRGRNTESEMNAQGTLTGTSSKTLRGTIDFVRGCKGSVGSETETVLLADEGVENRTVPVILCDEDDVMGNHGATIGHTRPEQAFYMACRGLNEQACENLFSQAVFEAAALAAPHARIRKQIARLAATRNLELLACAEEEED